MKDLEKIFKKAPWRPVPDRLDRKVEMEFRKAEERRPMFFFQPVPLWAHIGICLICLCAGFTLHSLLPGKPGEPGEPRLSYLVISNQSSSIPFFDEMNKRSER